jgi:hypothetical protein
VRYFTTLPASMLFGVEWEDDSCIRTGMDLYRSGRGLTKRLFFLFFFSFFGWGKTESTWYVGH